MPAAPTITKLGDTSPLPYLVLASLGASALAVWLAPELGAAGARTVIAAQAIVNGQSGPGIVHESSLLPWLIALLTRAIGVETDVAARLINGFWFVCLCCAFVAFVERLSGRDERLWLAAFLVLWLPSLNMLRAEPVAVIPAAALMLAGLVTLWDFLALRNEWFAFKALVLLLAAAAFQLPVLVMIAPLVWVWLRRHGTPTVIAGTAVAVLVLGTAVIAVGLAYAAQHPADWEQARAQWLAALRAGIQGIVDEYAFRLDAIRREFLGEYAKGYGAAVVLMSAVAVASSAVAAVLGWFLAPVLLALVRRPRLADFEYSGVWLSVILVGLVPVALGAVLHTARTWALLPALCLLAAAPSCFKSTHGRRHLPTTILSGAALLACILYGVVAPDWRRDQSLLREAGSWFRETADPDARAYFGHPGLAYYAGRTGQTARTKATAWQETIALFWQPDAPSYDYILAYVDPAHQYREAQLLGHAKHAAVKEFSDERGARVIVLMP